MNTEKILKELVEIPSTTINTKACKEAIEYIEKIATKNGLKAKILEKNNVYCLLIAKKLKKKYKVLLNGHLDVVPASDDMFKIQIKGNRMYGRGTSDMKGANVAMLLAYLQAVKEGLGDDTLLMYTTDEEFGGFNGMTNFISQGYTADIAFIPDGGQSWSVCTDEKGVFHIVFEATGESAHGSRPWLGDNAVLKLITVYENIQKEFEKKWGLPSNEDNWKPTCNLGSLNGGDNANKVPNNAIMKIDIRYPSPVTQKVLEKIILKSLVKGVTWKCISSGSPLSLEKNNPFLKTWNSIVGGKPKYEKEPGASDGRFLAEKGIPVILTKPISSDPHIDNEWVDLKDLELFKEKITEWLRQI